MNGPLAVAIDVSAVPAAPVGAGRYTIALVAALAELGEEGSASGSPCAPAGRSADLTLFARRDDAARWPAVAPRARLEPVAPAALAARLAWGELGLGTALRRLSGAGAPEVLHAPHYTMPRRPPVPVVVTVHDLTFHDHPEWHERTKVVFFGRALRLAARRADLVVCVSRRTAARFEELYAPSAPVVVIPHGIDHRRFRPTEPVPGADEAALAALGVEPPYLLHLGTLEPRKNLPVLVGAFERLAAGTPALRLVLAGRRAWGAAALEAAIAASPVAGRVLRLGYVPDELLPPLLRGAAAVVYASLEEGFGLPALEAVACGVPLVTSEGSVMAEMLGEAAVLAPPDDPELLAVATGRALAGGSDATGRRSAGLALAGRFSWERSAACHLAAYRRAAR